MFRARRNTDLTAIALQHDEGAIADPQAMEENPSSIDRRWPRGPRGYMPILLAKPGELQALERLDPALRQRVIPLIEAREARIDRATGEPRRSLERQVEVNVGALARTFGRQAEFLLDPAGLGGVTGAVNDRIGADVLFARAAEHLLHFVPVVRLGQSRRERAAAYAHRSRGLCVRLSRDDLDERLGDRLERLLRRPRVAATSIDLVLDYGSVARLQELEVHELHGRVVRDLRRLPRLREWRSLALAMSAFPPMSGLRDLHRFERVEWLIWDRLRTEGGIDRMPTFGDYAVEGAGHGSNIDAMFLRNTPPSIRYTHGDHWIVVRGQRTDERALATQYSEMARRHMVGAAFFEGVEHCDGCLAVVAAARRAARAGDRTAWRRHGALHHLTVVTGQIRELRDV